MCNDSYKNAPLLLAFHEFLLPSGGKGSGGDCSVIASTKIEKISKIIRCVNFEKYD